MLTTVNSRVLLNFRSDASYQLLLINDGAADEFILADLPGYGFAKVSDAEKLKWADLLENYLAKEPRLKHVFFLVDIRHDPTRDDVTMYNYLFKNNVPFTIAATKSDKVSKSQVKTDFAV